MKKFEIVFKSGKSIFIDCANRANVTTEAIKSGKMDKLDCYDIHEILEVDPFFNQKLKKEIVGENESEELFP